MTNRFALFAAMCLFAANILLGQDATGRVAGVVTDPSGAVIVGAKVIATDVATGVSRETTTDAEGAYQILQVPIGSYKIAAEAPGFRHTVTTEAPLRINETLRIDVKLEVGSTSDVVQVEADATGVE